MKLYIILFFIAATFALQIELTPQMPSFCLQHTTTSKSYSEVTIDYKASETIVFSVISPTRRPEVKVQRSSQQFSLVPLLTGEYNFCFSLMTKRPVKVDISYQYDDPDFAPVAAEDVDKMEQEIYFLRTSFNEMHDDFVNINDRLYETMKAETSNTNYLWLAVLIVISATVLNIYIQVKGISMILLIRAQQAKKACK